LFYAIVTSDNHFFRECYGTLWNFMELYVWGLSSETLWNFLMCLMERNNYGTHHVTHFEFLVPVKYIWNDLS